MKTRGGFFRQADFCLKRFSEPHCSIYLWEGHVLLLYGTTWNQHHTNKNTSLASPQIKCKMWLHPRNYVCLTSSHVKPWRLQQHGEIWSMCLWCLYRNCLFYIEPNRSQHFLVCSGQYFCFTARKSRVRIPTLGLFCVEFVCSPCVCTGRCRNMCGRLIRLMKDFEIPSQLCCLIELSCSKIT